MAEINEYGVFCDADRSDWFDASGHYWGFHDGGKTELGTQGERICKFPCPSNVTDTWHGYPLSHSLSGTVPRDLIAAVQSFIDDQLIDKSLGRNIQRGKL